MFYYPCNRMYQKVLSLVARKQGHFFQKKCMECKECAHIFFQAHELPDGRCNVCSLLFRRKQKQVDKHVENAQESKLSFKVLT